MCQPRDREDQRLGNEGEVGRTRRSVPRSEPDKLKPSCGVHAPSKTMAHLREHRMSNLLFFRRSYEYRHAAAAAFRNARALPIGSERNAQCVLVRGLSELARTEAWLEGQRSHGRAFLRARTSDWSDRWPPLAHEEPL